MRKLLILCVLLSFSPLGAQAQCQSYTTVTGTVSDPNGILWYGAAGGTVQVDLTPSSASPTCTPAVSGATPAQFTTHMGPTPLTGSGAFAINVPPNSIISPASTQWIFTFNISPGVLPPFGTGPQSFSVTVTISGASQDITTQITAAPVPALTGASGGGVAGWSVDVSRNFIPAAGTQSLGSPTNPIFNLNIAGAENWSTHSPIIQSAPGGSCGIPAAATSTSGWSICQGDSATKLNYQSTYGSPWEPTPSVQTSTCTMSSGACTATWPNTYGAWAATPLCFWSWNGTGTLTGVVKAVPSTSGCVVTSSVSGDNAVIVVQGVGNPN